PKPRTCWKTPFPCAPPGTLASLANGRLVFSKDKERIWNCLLAHVLLIYSSQICLKAFDNSSSLTGSWKCSTASSESGLVNPGLPIPLTALLLH
ncbi:hypothetical protein LEMLEM_LOCUS19315, partial [Lemmus lemmus]